MFGSVLPSTAPHTEFVRPLPFELSLLMCFKSPLQFHIPEQLSCSKKLEIQRGLFLLFYPFVHQLRLTPTRLEKQSWVQPLVCRSMSSLWTLKPAGSFCLCVPSVSLNPALAALRADLAVQVPHGPCGRALSPTVQERGMDGEPLSQMQEGGGMRIPCPCQGTGEGSRGAALPSGCRMRRGLRSCRFGIVAVALEGRRESLGSAHSALLESCGVTDRKGMSQCPAEVLS